MLLKFLYTKIYPSNFPKVENMSKPLKHSGFILLFIMIFFALIKTLPSEATNLNGVITTEVMKCMTNCIHYEGNSTATKDICKLRCSNERFTEASNLDCMGDYKKCRKGCSKNNQACNRRCKKKLLNCN